VKSLALLLILVFTWIAGLLAFAARVERSTPAPAPQTAEAIVALTGRSNARLAAAMRLLEAHKGQRLLISGVNREATREDIRSVARAPSGLYDCCVDLGFTAVDTVGNARETAVWARRWGYRRLIVVTSDYHLPRSLLELKGAMPEAELQGFPVRTPDLDSAHWWRSRASAKRMIVEYSKYVVILARESFLSLGPRPPEADQPPQRQAPAR
jgi:uncharacterized SAM-binding protein YcdF (DUF218 family)